MHSLGCIIRTLQTSPDKASKLTLSSLMPTVGDWDKRHAQRNLLLNRGSVQIVSIIYFHVRIRAFPNIRGCWDPGNHRPNIQIEQLAVDEIAVESPLHLLTGLKKDTFRSRSPAPYSKSRVFGIGLVMSYLD